MSEIRVWAPRLDGVGLDAAGERRPLRAEAGGWYGGVALEVGADYGFEVGGRTLPDPRSRHQPRGVHGPSRVLDQAEFRWTDAGWPGVALEPGLVLYELHVGTFTPEGTFAAAARKLGYLRELGVGAVEIMPVAEFPGRRGWGYDGVDLYAPHHAYGGPEGLKQFVDACHAHGLGAVLDVVYNHLGPEGNYLDVFGPYFTSRYTTPWGQAVNLDGPDSDEVRRFICDNAVMWLRDYHFDGLRLDAVHELMDTSAVNVLEQLAEAVHEEGRRLGRPCFAIAESDLNDPRLVRSRAQVGYGLDAQWLDDFHHSLYALLSGERGGYYQDFGSLADLATSLRQGYVYDGRWSEYRRRTFGRSPAGLQGASFVAYLQNHDQVGNRAAGDRAAAVLSPGKLRIGAGLVLCSPFVPLLFQGEEWGAGTPFQYFTDLQDPGLAADVSRGRRQEFAAFGWDPSQVPDPQDVRTFQRSKLDWSEPEREPHRSLLEWHRRLLQLRRSRPELTDGRLDLLTTAFDEGAGWLVVGRSGVVIACNFGPQARKLPLPLTPNRLLLASAEAAVHESSLELAPESVAVVA